MKPKLTKSRFLQKVILVCVLLGTVPSIAVGIFSYQKASETIQRKVDESCANQLSQVQMSVENHLTAARTTLLQLLESPSISQSAETEKSGAEFENFHRIEDAINSLPSVGVSTMYNVSIANAGQNWAVDKAGIYDLSDFETKEPAFSSFIKAPQNSFWNDDTNLLDSNGNTVSRCATVVQKFKKRTGTLIGTVDIPYSNLNALVDPAETSGIIMLFNTNDRQIYSCRPKKSLGFSSSIISRIRQNQESNGSLNMTADSEAWNITYMRSNYNHWYYVLATPTADLVRDSQMIGWFTFLVCIVLILLIVAVSLCISRRAYRPVQHLSAVLAGGDCSAAPPAKDEVAQIETRVSSLMTDHSKLKEEFGFQTQKLREYFVSKLLVSVTSSDLIRSKAQQYGLPCPPPVMAVMVIQPDPLCENSPYRESDTDILLYAISNIAAEIFADRSVILTAIMDGRQITVFSVDGKDYKDTAYACANRIRKTLREQLGFDTSCIVSRPVERYEDLHQNYLECVHILQYRFLSRNSVTLAEDINKNYDFNYVYPQDLEAEILDAAKTCDREKCREMIHQFLDAVFNIQGNLGVYKMFLLRLTSSLIILGNHGNEDLCRCEAEYVRRIYNMHDREQIETWLQNTVAEAVIRSIEQSKDNHLRQICDSVLEIIHKEYSNKLTLETCAQKLNYHPSYIRRVLKKEMGINFRDYLLQYQMNVAKKWLIETEDSVADIAQKLQYENTENFVRSFKKIVGCTPKQYREGRNDT